MTGAAIKTVMEDVCDNLVNPDPYYRQGGDMVRVGGLQYTCDPRAGMGSRILDMRLAGKTVNPKRKYRVASWAPVSEEARNVGGDPIWSVIARYLRDQKLITPRKPNVPRLKGMDRNPGMA